MQTRKSGARPDVEQAAQAAPAPMAPQLSLYGGTCSACGTAWSCPACLATRDCSDCTPSARCGSCRNVHSKAHRAAGKHVSLESGKRRPRPVEESPLKRRERLVPSPPPPRASLAPPLRPPPSLTSQHETCCRRVVRKRKPSGARRRALCKRSVSVTACTVRRTLYRMVRIMVRRIDLRAFSIARLVTRDVSRGPSVPIC